MPSRRPRAVPGAVLGDTRGDGRALRVTWHHETGVVVLSVWRDNLCTTTVRLAPDDAVALIQVLVAGLPRDEASPRDRHSAAGA